MEVKNYIFKVNRGQIEDFGMTRHPHQLYLEISTEDFLDIIEKLAGEGKKHGNGRGITLQGTLSRPIK